MARLRTTIQTVTHYGLARLRVLCTTRVLWSGLTVGGIVLLAVIGTSAAWRARTSGADNEGAAGDSFTSSTAALIATTALSPTLPAERSEPPVPATPLQGQVVVPSDLPDELRNPFTDTVIGEERAQRSETQRLRATRQQLEQVQTEVKIAEQRKELARIAHETRAITHPPRVATPTPSPPLPRLTVLSVSSTAALVQHDQWRQIVQRGARLNGWTVVRLTPTGITVQRGHRHAFLPLSFATPATKAR